MRVIQLRAHCATTGEILAYEYFNTSLNWGYYWLSADEELEERVCNASTEYFRHPHPLGQVERFLFTGKTDKNNVDIYEGDKLKFDPKEWGSEESVFTIVWDNDCASFIGNGVPSDWSNFCTVIKPENS